MLSGFVIYPPEKSLQIILVCINILFDNKLTKSVVNNVYIFNIARSNVRKAASKSANLKDDICSVALKLFSEKGYEATNLSEVAEILGITRTPLYYYFTDKKSLYAEAIKKHLAKKRELYTQMADKESDIFTWLRQHIELACSNTTDTVLFNVLGYDEFRSLSDLNDETCRYIYALKRRRVARAIDTGELPPDTDIDLFLSNVYVMSYGLTYVINQSILSQDLKSSPKKIADLTDLFVQEIKCTHTLNNAR